MSLGVNAVGMRMPAAFGTTLPTRIATGAGSNVALGMGQNAATQQILEADGLDALAESYDPLNGQALALDTLMGAAFGWRAHVEAKASPLTPSQRDAVLSANNADHFANRTMPGEPLTPDAAVQHQTALTRAAEQLLRGEPVNTAGTVDLEQFKLRPEIAEALKPEPVVNRRDPVVVQATLAGLGDQFGFKTTSTTRTKAENDAAGGVENSQHLEHRGTARDWSVKGKTHEQIAAFAAALREQGFQVITKPHGTGPHVHAELRADRDPDAANFGLPEAPRTIADVDPFWEAVPAGPDGARETVHIATPEREAYRDRLVEEHFAQTEARIRAPGERPIAYVMGGGGASGKGTILKLLKAEGEIPRGLVEIDPDAIKTGDDDRGLSGIPEYRQMLERGDSRAAAVVHEESSQVAARVKQRAIEEGRDFVLDRTLGDPGKAERELAELAKTHEIRLYGVTVDPSDAVERAVKRAKGSGRFVPLDHLLRAHKGFAAGFEGYAMVADQVRLYDNTLTPKLLAGGGKGALDVYESNGYNSFRKRSEIDEKATTHRALADSGSAGSQAEAGGSGGLGESTRGAGERGDRARPQERSQAELDPAAFPVQGDDATVVTERGLRLPVRYAVVDIADLVTSHDDALNVNPDFPAEFQPRDRARAASEQQIARIAGNINPELLAESPKAADGAPIVGTDRVVESGNARTIALRRAYANGKADEYRAFLVENAARFGLDPAALEGIEQPVARACRARGARSRRLRPPGERVHRRRDERHRAGRRRCAHAAGSRGSANARRWHDQHARERALRRRASSRRSGRTSARRWQPPTASSRSRARPGSAMPSLRAPTATPSSWR